MRYLIILFILSVVCQVVSAQQTKIVGHIYDTHSNLPIADYHIYLVDGKKDMAATTSDRNGCFRFNRVVVIGRLLRVTHINYKSKQIAISNVTDSVRIYLEPKNLLLNEVTVYSSFKQKGNSYTYTPDDAASSISVIGEPDVVRHISSKPGISQGIEGMLGLFVRGSNNGSNSILYNGVPVYSSNHLGMFSAFHPETIHESTFYLGGTPAAYSNFHPHLWI